MVLGIFNIGNSELLIILVIALVLFGSRLPDVARSLGKSVNSFKRGLKDVEDELNAPEPPATPPKSITTRIETPASNVAQSVEREKTPQG